MINEKSEKLNISNDMFKLKLKEHQKRLLNRTIKIETTKANSLHKYGLLSDVPGSGKTFVILAHIYLMKKLYDENYKSLIVVPNNIFNQWKETIDIFLGEKTLRIKYLTENKEINSLYGKMDLLIDYDIIITLPSNYILLSQTLLNIPKFTFSSVFFDECDTIKTYISNQITSSFTWFVSASIKNSDIFNDSGIVKIGMYEIPLNILLENDCFCDTTYVIKCMKLPNLINETFFCHDFYLDCILNQVLDVDMMKNINAHDYNEMLKYIGNKEIKNTKDVLKHYYINACSILLSKIDDLKNIEAKMKFSNSIDYNNYNITKKKLDDERSHYNEIVVTIRKYCREYNVCMKCFEMIEEQELENEYRNKNVQYYISECEDCICKNCINDIIKNTVDDNAMNDKFQNASDKIKYLCYYCNKQHTLTSLKSEQVEQNKVEIKFYDKLKLLGDVIDICEGKIILFTEYRSVDKLLGEICINKGIEFLELNAGNVIDIDNIMDTFKNSAVRILFISNIQFGVGLNIEYVDNIIFFHKTDMSKKLQIVGRSQRYGRVKKLRIYELLYLNENE